MAGGAGRLGSLPPLAGLGESLPVPLTPDPQPLLGGGQDPSVPPQIRGRSVAGGGSDEGLLGAPEIRSEAPVRTRGLPPARSRDRGVRAGGPGLLGPLAARGGEWGPVARAGGGAGSPDSWVLCLAGGKCSVGDLQAVVELALRPPRGRLGGGDVWTWC
ncbi:unnamed protein product [Caretta caretta]